MNRLLLFHFDARRLALFPVAKYAALLERAMVVSSQVQGKS